MSNGGRGMIFSFKDCYFLPGDDCRLRGFIKLLGALLIRSRMLYEWRAAVCWVQSTLFPSPHLGPSCWTWNQPRGEDYTKLIDKWWESGLCFPCTVSCWSAHSWWWDGKREKTNTEGKLYLLNLLSSPLFLAAPGSRYWPYLRDEVIKTWGS